MSGLSAFLKKNAVQVENVKVAVSGRFLEKGKPVEWEIRAITSQEDEALRRECTRRVQVPGKRNQYVPEMDANLYVGKLAAACTVFPNLDDKELQDSYGVMGAEALLRTMLTSGEFDEYAQRVYDHNNHGTMQELVDEVKN